MGHELIDKDDLTLDIREGRDSAGGVGSVGDEKDGLCGCGVAVVTGDISIMSPKSDSGICVERGILRGRVRGDEGRVRDDPPREVGDGERELEKRGLRERKRIFCILLPTDVDEDEPGDIILFPILDMCSI